MGWRQIFDTWKRVFTNWKYLTATIITAVVFYSFNVLISSWKNLIVFYSSFGFFKTVKFLFILWIGFKSTVILHSFISLIIVSILLGMLISLIFYKLRFNILRDKKASFFGGVGIFLAAFAPGCAACGIGLASVLGIGAGFLAFLPYDGLELSIASIGILSFTMVSITKNMYVCKTINFPISRKSKKKDIHTNYKI